MTKPPIHKMLIPYPQKRKREMAAYSKRHYGQYKWRLNNPKVIVIHFAEAGSISAIFNTFRTDQPDVEFHELPERLLALRGRRLGRGLQVRAADDPLPPHGRAQLDARSASSTSASPTRTSSTGPRS